MARQDQLHLNPQAFQEAIKGNTEVETLLSRVYYETVRSASHIDSYRKDPHGYAQKYPQFVSHEASNHPPMLSLKEDDFQMAKQVASAFTIVCAPPVRQPGDNQFHQVDYRTDEITALRVGHIGEDQIIIANGQVLLRRDALTTRPLTTAEITQHAQEIEKAIKPSRLKRLTGVVPHLGEDSWSAFRETFAPIEKKIHEAQWSTPQPSKEDRTFADFDQAKNRLKEQMQILEEVAAGKPWQEIPALAEANEAITTEEAKKALAEIRAQITGTLLESSAQMRDLLIKHGFQKEAEEIRDIRDNVIIPAIAKSLR